MQSKIVADRVLSPGSHTLGFDFAMAGEGGTLTISVDGETVATGPVERRPKILAGNGETFDTGRDTNVPVSPDYSGEGAFSGSIGKVAVSVKMPQMKAHGSNPQRKEDN
jgi:arylsulfatase